MDFLDLKEQRSPGGLRCLAGFYKEKIFQINACPVAAILTLPVISTEVKPPS